MFLAADQYTSTTDAEEELFRRIVQKHWWSRTAGEEIVSEDLVLKKILLKSDTPDTPKEAAKQF